MDVDHNLYFFFPMAWYYEVNNNSKLRVPLLVDGEDEDEDGEDDCDGYDCEVDVGSRACHPGGVDSSDCDIAMEDDVGFPEID